MLNREIIKIIKDYAHDYRWTEISSEELEKIFTNFYHKARTEDDNMKVYSEAKKIWKS